MKKRLLILSFIVLLLVLVGCGSKSKPQKELRYFVLHMDAGEVKTFSSKMSVRIDDALVKEVNSQYTKNGDQWNLTKTTKTLNDASSEEEYTIVSENEVVQGENIGKITLRFTDEDCENVYILDNQCKFSIKASSIEKVLGVEAEIAEMLIETDSEDSVILLQIHYRKSSGEDIYIDNTYAR